MRLVIDTNVVVSGLLWLGNPGRLLEAAALGQVTLYTSPAPVAELATTLAAPKLARTVIGSGMTLDELLARYVNVAIVVQPATVPRVVPNDPDDDQVIAAAVEARADLIVSGDEDLHELGGSHQGIFIVTPAQAMQLIRR